MLTRGAIGNLVNRYRAVLKKCHLINTFGSLAVASMLVAGGAAVAMGGTQTPIEQTLLSYTGEGFIENTDAVNTTDGTFDWTDTDGVLTITATDQNPGGRGVVTNLYEDSDSGALEIVSSKGMTITGSSFENNKDSNAGAAVSLWGNGGTGTEALSHSISKTTFSGNESTNLGGAVAIFKWSSDYAVNSNTTFEDVVFTGNKTTSGTGQGGAIYAESENVTIIGDKTSDTDYTTAFTGNSAYQGGAIYVTKGSPLTVDGVAFTGNNATAQGGAIYTDPHADAKISNSLFEENNAKSGGAIALWGDGGDNNTVLNQVIENTTFRGNTASSKGGAVAILKYDGAAQSNTSFNNVTFEANSSEGTGGAVHIESENVSIADATFTGNTANENNGQGGAIYVSKGSDLSIDGSTFTGNEAAKYGGAIAGTWQDASKVDIKNSVFSENSAQTGGAIILWNPAEPTSYSITSTDFSGNTSDKKGGAIALLSERDDDNMDIALEDVSFTDNTAGESGGALHIEYAETTLKDATFTGNTAGTKGGAVYIDELSSTKLSGDNLFENNTAADVANDVHNKGILTVADGTTLMNSGYTQEGETSALIVKSGATLGIAMPDLGGVTAENGEAMLALGQKLDLSEGGSLTVGSVDEANDAQLAFGSDSMLVVDGKVAQNGAAITGNGNDKITVEKGSRLYIANAQADETYTITDRINTSENEYWDAANLLAGRLIEAGITTTPDGDIVVMTEGRDAAAVLPGIIPVAALNTMTGDQLYDVDASDMGVRFLSRAMDNSGTYLTGDAQAVDTVNEVSRAAVTAGVQNTALRLADAGADQLIHHLSLSFFGKENNIHKDGVDIWATPMYGNTYTHGMTASGTSVRGNYGGMVLGADALVGEVMGGKVRVGAAINGGGGKTETRGTATSTENSYNFGGVNLYAGWNLDSLNVMASVGYAMADHDVEMNLPASLGMGRADADVDTNAFIADLRAEYQINTSVVDVLPHAGVRYTALNTESHDLKVNGSTLNSVASDTQHIVQFPIGVTLSKDIDVSGWNVKPLADVSVIPAAGEKKNTTKVSYTGVNAVDGVNTRIMDSTSWSGMVGVQAEKGNFALGLNYGIQASSHETDQNVNVGFSWKF